MGDWSEKQRLREAIIEAVKLEDYNLVAKLLNNGADINVCEGGYLVKKNLLLMAMERKNIDISVLLIERGIDLNFSITIDKEEKTALDLSREYNLNEVTDHIERKTSANEDLMGAMKLGVIDLAARAIDGGADINMIINEGKEHGGTLLMIAICSEQPQMAKFLISRGIYLDYVNKWDDASNGEHYEETAESLAEKMNYLDVIECIKKQRNKKDEGSDVSDSIQHSEQVKSNNEVEDVGDFDAEDKVADEANSKHRKKKKSNPSKSGSCVLF